MLNSGQWGDREKTQYLPVKEFAYCLGRSCVNKQINGTWSVCVIIPAEFKVLQEEKQARSTQFYLGISVEAFSMRLHNLSLRELKVGFLFF